MSINNPQGQGQFNQPGYMGGQGMYPPYMQHRGGYQRGGRGGRGQRGGMGRGGNMQHQPQPNQQFQQQQPHTMPQPGFPYNQQMPPNMTRPAFPQQFPPLMQQTRPQQFPPQIGLPHYEPAVYDNIKDINEKKQFIGNSIYPQIEAALGTQFAGKITGMLLDETAVDIDRLLKDQAYLNGKVHEAHQLLVQTQPTPQPTPGQNM